MNDTLPEDTTDQPVLNGQDKKRRIAVAAFNGNVGTLTFSKEMGGQVLTIDGDKIHNAGLMAAFGAITALQNSYANSDDPVAAATACLTKLNQGQWSPGLPRREAQLDSLTQALIEHLHKETGKTVTPEYLAEKYLPAYQKQHGLGSIGAARRKIRQHGDIAKRIADIETARAKEAAAAVQRAPRESLVLDI